MENVFQSFSDAEVAAPAERGNPIISLQLAVGRPPEFANHKKN